MEILRFISYLFPLHNTDMEMFPLVRPFCMKTLCLIQRLPISKRFPFPLSSPSFLSPSLSPSPFLTSSLFPLLPLILPPLQVSNATDLLVTQLQKSKTREGVALNADYHPSFFSLLTSLDRSLSSFSEWKKSAALFSSSSATNASLFASVLY